MNITVSKPMKLKPIEKKGGLFPAAYMLSSCRLFIKKLMAFAIFGPSFTFLCDQKLSAASAISMHNNCNSEESEDHENFADKECIVNERSL